MTLNALKILGIGVSLVGFGVTSAANWISDKKTEAVIQQKVDDAVNARMGNTQTTAQAEANSYVGNEYANNQYTENSYNNNPYEGNYYLTHK